MTSIVRLLNDLVAVPSVNPAFLPLGDPRAGEHGVGELLAEVAGTAGLDVSLEEVEAGRPNLLVRLVPRGKARRRVLLVPHLDTVAGDGPEAYRPRLRAGRLHGRGACDTKGSVASMFSALLRVARARRRPQETEILFAGVVDEENRQLGSRALASGGLKGDLAIVGEPTGLRVVTAHKGNLWLQLETRGKAAHGCRPQLGRNAVTAMARVVVELESNYREHLNGCRHPLLGSASVNVGTINGGRQPNIVPDGCAIGVDRRTLPGESDAGVRREMSRWLRSAGCSVRLLNVRGVSCPPMETRIDLPLVRELMRAAGQRKPSGVDYFCDAAVLSAGGIPSVVFGPGEIAQAHTADEWVEVRQVEAAADLLEGFLLGLA